MGRALWQAEERATQVPLVSVRYPEADLEDAYAIQAELVAARYRAGHKRVGWKIGLTSRAMQEALGITTPDSGVICDDMIFAPGSVIPKGRFIQPRIEAELAFVLKADLAGDGVTRADVIAATDHIRPAIEILDTRILRKDPATGQMRSVIDTIADNAANGGLVSLPVAIPPDTDLRWIGAIVRRDGVVEETGLGAGVLDDPVLGIVWLCHRLAQFGQGLKAGEIVLSGSFIRPVECPPGTEVAADFGPWGTIRFAFG